MAEPQETPQENPQAPPPQDRAGRIGIHPHVARQYHDLGGRLEGMTRISGNTLILLPADLLLDVLFQGRENIQMLRDVLLRVVPADQLTGFVRQFGTKAEDGTPIPPEEISPEVAASVITQTIYEIGLERSKSTRPGEFMAPANGPSAINITYPDGRAAVSIIFMPDRDTPPERWFGDLAFLINSHVPMREGALGSADDWALAIAAHEAGHAGRQINDRHDLHEDLRELNTLRGEVLADRMMGQFATSAMGIDPVVVRAMENARAIGAFRQTTPSFAGEPGQPGQAPVEPELGAMLASLSQASHQTGIFLDDGADPDAAAIAEGRRQMVAARNLLAQRYGDWALRAQFMDPDIDADDEILGRDGEIDEPSEIAFMNQPAELTSMSASFLRAAQADDPERYTAIATRAGYSGLLSPFLNEDGMPMEYLYTKYLLERGEFARIGPQAQEFAADYVAAVEASINLDAVAQNSREYDFQNAEDMYRQFRTVFDDPASLYAEAPAPPAPLPPAAAPTATP